MADSSRLLHVAEALVEGGLCAVEVTMTVPNALQAMRRVAREVDGVLLGAGSVLDAETARRAVEAGARYIVSPVLDEAVIEAAHAEGAAVLPGAFSPTEVQRAYRLGAEFVKVFPAGMLGPAYLKALLAPLPHVKLVPTGGVSLDNAGTWIQAGARAVGVGSALLDREAIAEGRYEQITENARRLRASVDAARSATPA